jgi:hypothetical protein
MKLRPRSIPITRAHDYKKFLQGGPDVSRGQFFQKAPPLAALGKIFFYIDLFAIFF